MTHREWLSSQNNSSLGTWLAELVQDADHYGNRCYICPADAFCDAHREKGETPWCPQVLEDWLNSEAGA